jgi:two-component system sensor histidine kinase DevS
VTDGAPAGINTPEVVAGIAQGIVEQAPDGILVVDGDGRIQWANERLANMLDWDAGTLVGETVEVLIPDSVREAHVGHRADYRRNPHQRPMGVGLDLQARRRDGTLVPVEIALSPLRTERGTWVMAIVRDMTERIAAQEALSRAESALALTDERERIARDLHDTVIQRLFAAGLGLQAAAISAPSDVASRIESIVDELDATIRQIRNSIFQLHAAPPGASLRGDVLDVVAEAARALGFDPEVSFLGPVDTTSSPELRTALLATLREALSNVARHAQARRARVLVYAGEHLRLEVADDGVGVAGGGRRGEGLKNMAARAESLGGSCAITGGEAGGTTVTWQVPLP